MILLIIDNNTLRIGEKEYPIEDLFSEEFYSLSNEKADYYKTDLFCVNELFAQLVQKYLALDLFVFENSVDAIDIKNAKDGYRLYAIDIANKRGLKLIGNKCGIKFKILTEAFFVRAASFLYLEYLMIKLPASGETIVQTPEFAVHRAKSAIQKFRPFTEIPKEIENPYQKDSIYRLFPRLKRMGWVLKSYIKASSIDRQMRSFYKSTVGDYSSLQAISFYQKRIVHTLLYEHLLDEYFKHFQGCTFYTGNNLCRFSVIEDNMARKYSIKSVNYPHGLEYGYKYPRGFSSDVFYANSEFAAKELNKLYNTDKYVFDEAITGRMFKLKGVPAHEKHVVFFTEQQEYHVNKAILTELQPLLKKDGIEILVKLHPGDTKEHYSDCDFKYITDYGEAMTNNICIARKSTVLLEAVYNNSTAIAIITTTKDKSVFNTFPSLQSEKIIKTYNVQDLYKEIIKQI
jgi:hypothetical protein